MVKALQITSINGIYHTSQTMDSRSIERLQLTHIEGRIRVINKLRATIKILRDRSIGSQLTLMEFAR